MHHQTEYINKDKQDIVNWYTSMKMGEYLYNKSVPALDCIDFDDDFLEDLDEFYYENDESILPGWF